MKTYTHPTTEDFTQTMFQHFSYIYGHFLDFSAAWLALPINWYRNFQSTLERFTVIVYLIISLAHKSALVYVDAAKKNNMNRQSSHEFLNGPLYKKNLYRWIRNCRTLLHSPWADAVCVFTRQQHFSNHLKIITLYQKSTQSINVWLLEQQSCQILSQLFPSIEPQEYASTHS